MKVANGGGLTKSTPAIKSLLHFWLIRAACPLTASLMGDLMIAVRPCIIVIFTLLGMNAQAAECVRFNRIGNYPNIQQIPTPNGSMLVIWPVDGVRLPVKSVSLPAGVMATGAVPGRVPLSFIFLDKSHSARAALGISMNYYVTETGADERFLGFWGQKDFKPHRTFIPGFPLSVLNKFKSPVPDFARPASRTELTLPGAVLSEFCMDPGDRISLTRRQIMQGLRKR